MAAIGVVVTTEAGTTVAASGALDLAAASAAASVAASAVEAEDVANPGFSSSEELLIESAFPRTNLQPWGMHIGTIAFPRTFEAPLHFKIFPGVPCASAANNSNKME
jgi:hypothetical protein